MTTTLTGFTNDQFNSPTMACNQITINNTPVDPTDGTNKAYVDLVSGGFNYKNTTYASTTANLNATYANGAAGVGATLTNAGVQAAFATDGTSPAVNSRILVQFETTQAYNGIYTLTTVGDGVTNWVLTRSLDYDTPAEMNPGDIVPVSDGTLYADTLWIQTQNVIAVGVTPVNFNQFGGQITVDQYEVVVGGPANTVVSLGSTGTATQVLTSQGPGMNPIWADNASGSLSINTQIFTSSGTYTPTAGMVYCEVTLVGGGAGGANTNSGGSTAVAYGGGGGGGAATIIANFSAADIGASQSFTIGGGGGGNSNGGNSVFNYIGGNITAGGGNSTNTSNGGSGGSASLSGPVTAIGINGQGGGAAFGLVIPVVNIAAVMSGAGGSSYFGGGGAGLYGTGSASTPHSSNGNGAIGYGGGGGGSWVAGTGGVSGGSGFGGVCVIKEYIGGFTTTFSWMDNSGAFTANANIGYFLTAASTVALPSSPSEGTTISFICDTASACTITASAGKKIKLGNSTSAIAGNIVNTLQGDSVTLVYRSSDSVWFGVGPVGNWTIN
tara:strand:- start:4093 stop:5754 length:1662 start_codon:yes stop_codon:yes gene_type:complete